MKDTGKGVCVQGFKAGGWKKGKYGVAIILSDSKATCGVAVTSNKVKAAPLAISLVHAKKGFVQGIVANSGNANAYTGKEGMEDAKKMCRMAATEVGLKERDFLVASTGVIGRRMDMDTIREGILNVAMNLRDTGGASLEAARAIMTTDKFPKMISVKTALKNGVEVEIGGIVKGAGMIAPQLHATMICFLTTNAYVTKAKMKAILQNTIDQSFNVTVVDNDMSTNDIVIFLANGLAGNKDVDANFQDAVNYVTRELAKMIARNSEGATKFIEVAVINAATVGDARKAARTVAGSNLVKTAIFGKDPNWGRIIAALGYSGVKLVPEKISLYINHVCLVDKGKVLAFQGTKELEDAKRELESGGIRILADLHVGKSEGLAYGCDLSYDYVKINAEYTT